MPLIITLLILAATIRCSNPVPAPARQAASLSPFRTAEPNPDAQSTFLESNLSSKPSRSKKLELGLVLITQNSTISSGNKTFKLGFFTSNGGLSWYLGIWYACIPTPTYVWVANRRAPVRNPASARAEIDAAGRLTVLETRGSLDLPVWQSTNRRKGNALKLLDSGNLVLLTGGGAVVWQSFDFPADTFLPGMNVTAMQSIICWRSAADPSPGLYSLRLKPPAFGEFELVYNDSESYWSTGNWDGKTFAGIPEMTVEYIYRFRFSNPFTPAATFGYTEVAPASAAAPPLTRFSVDPSGQLRQYTWSAQTQSWNMFWSQPENQCRVYGLCGGLGFCNGSRETEAGPCACIDGFRPSDSVRWRSGDFSGGCRLDDGFGGDGCDVSDEFENVGSVTFDGDAVPVPCAACSKGVCEKSCLSNCSCIGLLRNSRTNLCKQLYGSPSNLQNGAHGDALDEGDELFLRVRSKRSAKNAYRRDIVLLSTVAGSVLFLGLIVAALLILRRKIRRTRKEEEESVFAVTNLKVFSYKELQAVTRDFSEKLGHGGFGAVFRGELPDSTPVAVKRLERPSSGGNGGGEREFRAEVGTIGNIQHVNLVRLRGFCSENSHRLLVYDYMPNGPLSSYLRRRSSDGGGRGSLSWEVRFRVAIGTARGIAYLHEECRDCIIHCDIKPENILLDAGFAAKVSDFGLAKLVGRDFSRVLATMRGTWGYVAPEWISGVAITTKADVYSYGMTLLELIGGRRNVDPPPTASPARAVMSPPEARAEGWFFPPWAARQIIEGNVAAVMDGRLGGTYNTEEAERVAMVAVWCIQDDEDARPAMGTVVKMLEGVVEVGVPPPPKLLQALVSGESFRGVRGDSSNGGASTGSFHPVDGGQASRNSHSSSGN